MTAGLQILPEQPPINLFLPSLKLLCEDRGKYHQRTGSE